MASTNLDVIAYIIDNVEDSGTLFSLLTVSKDVFRYTCRILYRDPSRVFCSRPPSGSTESKMVSLIRLLLDISPAADDDTNTLREAFGLKRKQKQEAMSPPTTMLDYLSYIQHIRWRDTLESLPTGFLDSRKLTEYSIENGYQSTISSKLSKCTMARINYSTSTFRLVMAF
ncbi:hypothetical protein BGZ73_005903 [Actinomortierella ambigua]|nr:hypothetical protein BGZ73_005903 [Actinomortierella ambigua]